MFATLLCVQWFTRATQTPKSTSLPPIVRKRESFSDSRLLCSPETQLSVYSNWKLGARSSNPVIILLFAQTTSLRPMLSFSGTTRVVRTFPTGRMEVGRMNIRALAGLGAVFRACFNKDAYRGHRTFYWSLKLSGEELGYGTVRD